MPLKHFTETVLIVLLGVVVIVMGILLATLPPIPDGLLPWAIVFVLSLSYPLALYGVFRRNRADYWFRMLHFAPMLMALLWLFFQLLQRWVPKAQMAGFWFTWANTAFAVFLVLALTALFCLHVIRRRIPRLSALAVLAVLFIAIASIGEQYAWRPAIASVLWNGKPAFPSSGQIAYQPNDDKNLKPSDDPKEEEWRRKLREVAARSKASASQAASSLARSSARPVIASSSVSSRIIAVKPPKRLPTSGPEIEVLSGFLIAGYFGTVHYRAKRRA